ncbi:MAG TPA: arylsulfotransferase family protein, partial [Ignavibacteria bacterium]|nr:arylsulfotransferase family protein [Ignavibacteria bacterium]
HFEITDGLHENLTLPKIDYSHGNSIEPDWDGNLLISSRHMDEITKINRTTGDIIWRFGGLNNEFTFLNDTRGFTYQHDARRVAPRRITLFDNGNHHSPPYSRVVEYELDEVNKTAELVWEFDHNKEIFGFAMGNAQRLPNGNTVIGWGTGYPSITEVDPNGNIVFEMAQEDSSWTYRALRYDFRQPDNEIPEEFNLSQNYPNPFNPATNISFDIPSASNVVLEIYDILGRKVDELVNTNLTAGDYNILWNAENLSSGVYFYTLRTENFRETKKMVLLR